VKRRLVPCAAVLATLVLAAGAHAGRDLRVGFDDDTLKWMVRPNGNVGVHHDLGVGTTRITIPWRRGQRRPDRLAQTYLSRAAKAIALGQDVVVAVYGPASEAPVDRRLRREYCGYVRHVLARIPQFKGVVIWNEANSPRYWPPPTSATPTWRCAWPSAGSTWPQRQPIKYCSARHTCTWPGPARCCSRGGSGPHGQRLTKGTAAPPRSVSPAWSPAGPACVA